MMKEMGEPDEKNIPPVANNYQAKKQAGNGIRTNKH